jgi:hypothetical protein
VKRNRHLEQAVVAEENKWRAKPYREIAEVLQRVAVYQNVHENRKYFFEVHADRSVDQTQIVVRVEGSRWPIFLFGFAKYFVIDEGDTVRSAVDAEVF